MHWAFPINGDIMKIAMLGDGYVGLTIGTCLANLGNEVLVVGIIESRIKNLQKGILPIYEPGLKELVERNLKEKRLDFTLDAKKAVENSDIIFIAVGTPSDEDGSVDLTFVKNVAETIGRHMNNYKVVVDKSTVPVGTADVLKEIIKKSQPKPIPFDLVSNPEFLREGFGIKDFMNPDRIIIGADNEKAKDLMASLYRGIERTGKPIMITDVKSAEMIKYASNAFLATKISFINELSHLCEKVGADVKTVARGMGLDERIGPRFLQAGVGYGGSCFPKDVKGLIKTAKDYNCELKILETVEQVNKKQKLVAVIKLKSLVPDLSGKLIAVWGLSFKPNTDDMREAPSIVIINELQRLGARIRAFDPVAEGNARLIFKNVEYAETPYDAIKDADALVILTEWDEFRQLDLKVIKTLLKQPIIIDGRNVYDPSEMKDFKYLGIGRKIR